MGAKYGRLSTLMLCVPWDGGDGSLDLARACVCPDKTYQNKPVPFWQDWAKTTPQVEHTTAKTPLSEQGALKEEGIGLLAMPDD